MRADRDGGLLAYLACACTCTIWCGWGTHNHPHFSERPPLFAHRADEGNMSSESEGPESVHGESSGLACAACACPSHVQRLPVIPLPPTQELHWRFPTSHPQALKVLSALQEAAALSLLTPPPALLLPPDSKPTQLTHSVSVSAPKAQNAQRSGSMRPAGRACVLCVCANVCADDATCCCVSQARARRMRL